MIQTCISSFEILYLVHNVRQTLITKCLSALQSVSSIEETAYGRGAKPVASSHTEQEESHAALKIQEITSVLMTQISGESSASSADLKRTVHSVQGCGACCSTRHTHTHSHTFL